ncbi:patatin-like phospholipase family protein [Ideonella livida]|uniref:Phospholipase n=1 Tax=Ideonella livida TaxID=2707176 RepID=A0A7C9PKI9_9BURK|nr:patatin-like phospholipase family protein [Ideonella livida]NDY93334.1 phospholipase [Ideonella livida]
MKALQILAGPAALARLREGPLRPQEVRVVPGAAGGPKGLILGPMDRFLFGHWLPQGGHTVHLLGASIGAWRLAAACLPDPVAALDRLTADYITQDYPHAPGQAPTAATVSQVFGQTLAAHLGGQGAALLAHPQYRLHVFTSHGRGRWLQREGARWRTGLGYGLALAANVWRRPAMARWLERVVFSDPRSPLPLPLDDFPGQQVALTAGNLLPAVLASCSIPFWLQAVHDIPGGPPGAYWDGGITDYHFHLRYDRLGAPAPGQDPGWALYPHFQPTLVPGWLDKSLSWRHGATPALDRVIVLAPRPEWLARLPNAKLPDRQDFKVYAQDLPGRMRAWRQAVAESQRLADELSDWLAGGPVPPIAPLP